MVASKDDPKASAERMQGLLIRWQRSLELHTRYLKLDDAHYRHVQPWPPHERPAAWIVQLARQKVAELARSLAEHVARGDLSLALGLEQMVFLANLVGLQPAGRHIPLADPQNEQREIMGPADTGTGEMPREMPRSRAPRPAPRAPRSALTSESRQVIEDAVRLLQWGRKWHELGELISRLSERPSVGDARRILRTYRAQIEAAALSAGTQQ